jgi:hypothetical protein
MEQEECFGALQADQYCDLFRFETGADMGSFAKRLFVV